VHFWSKSNPPEGKPMRFYNWLENYKAAQIVTTSPPFRSQSYRFEAGHIELSEAE
jgi:hypothetical protein